MLVIDFASRQKKAQTVIPDTEAAAMIAAQEPKRETLRTDSLRIYLPWTGSVDRVKPEHEKSVQSAMLASSASFDVYMEHLQTGDGITVDHKVVRRCDSKAILGVVGKNFTPVQNSKAFDWFQPILDHSDAVLSNAGAVYGGTKTTIIAKLPGSTIEVGKGDVIDSYLKLTNSHDGRSCLKLEFLPLRLVCLNGLAAIQGGSILLNTRHTSKVGMRLDNVGDIVRKISDDYREVAKTFEMLAAKPVRSEAEFRAYVQKALELKAADSKIIDQCLINFQAGRGASLAGSTWWGAYNAVNEFLQWQANEDTRKGMESLLYGRNGVRNERALSLAVMHASAA